MIDRISQTLRSHLFLTRQNLPLALSDEERTYRAMKMIVARINAGEVGLYDPDNAGDSMAIVLAQLD